MKKFELSLTEFCPAMCPRLLLSSCLSPTTTGMMGTSFFVSMQVNLSTISCYSFGPPFLAPSTFSKIRQKLQDDCHPHGTLSQINLKPLQPIIVRKRETRLEWKCSLKVRMVKIDGKPRSPSQYLIMFFACTFSSPVDILPFLLYECLFGHYSLDFCSTSFETRQVRDKRLLFEDNSSRETRSYLILLLLWGDQVFLFLWSSLLISISHS